MLQWERERPEPVLALVGGRVVSPAGAVKVFGGKVSELVRVGIRQSGTVAGFLNGTKGTKEPLGVGRGGPREVEAAGRAMCEQRQGAGLLVAVGKVTAWG